MRLSQATTRLIGAVALLVNNSKLLAGAQPLAINLEMEPTLNPTDSPPHSFPHIPLHLVQSVMKTEVNEEFKEIDNKEDLWREMLRQEWSFHLSRGNGSYVDTSVSVLRGPPRSLLDNNNINNTDDGEARKPFLVCEHTPGKSGEECKREVQHIFHTEHVLPLYNKFEMTCFAVQSDPEIASLLPPNLQAIPFTTELKMAAQLPELIASDESGVERLEAQFCPGQVDTPSQANKLGWQLVEGILDKGERDRRLREFQQTRDWRPSFRKLFWEEALPTIDKDPSSYETDFCHSVVNACEVEITTTSLFLHTPVGVEQTPQIRQCLQVIIVNLSQRASVCFVGASRGIEPFNELASGIAQSGNPSWKPFHEVGLDGTGQVVGVSDTGLDLDNCYFRDSRRETPRTSLGDNVVDYVEPTARKVVQYISHGDGSDVVDGHGTHVAGTLAGRQSLDGVVESDGAGDGVAKGAKLAFFDFHDGNFIRVPAVTEILAAGYFAANAKIHSMSWGSPGVSRYTIREANLDSYLYLNPDLLVVAACGNLGQGGAVGSVSAPSISKNLIAVGASLNAHPHLRPWQEGPNHLADFSSRGPSDDGRIKPEIVAPGMYIQSARADPGFVGECDDTTSQGLRFSAGTSMATPIVAGVAAIVRQYFEEGWHGTGLKDESLGFNPRASLVKAVVLNGARGLTGIDKATGSIALYDNNQGFGLINLINSLPLQSANQIGSLFVNDKEIRTGEELVYSIDIEMDSGCVAPLSATLVWTDPTNGPFCHNGCVLNDLDLSVVDVDENAVYYPNGLNEADRLNNAERVIIDNPRRGARYLVRVQGFMLVQIQVFSLAVTGCFPINLPTQPPTSSPTLSPTNHPTYAPTLTPTRTRGGSSIAESTAVPSQLQSSERWSSEPCENQEGEIPRESGGSKTCQWLLESSNENSLYCEFLDVALFCPVVCSACRLFEVEAILGSEKVADSSLDGSLRYDGIQFNITTKENIIIESFELHLRHRTSYTIEIFSRSAPGMPWSLVCHGDVPGAGLSNLTPLPPGACAPLALREQERHELYVTLVGSQDLVLTPMSDPTFFSNEDMDVETGAAVAYLDDGRLPGYGWNGRIKYRSAEILPCQDETGIISMSCLVGQRPCSWLNDNLGRFEYLCQFADVANHCRETCNFCGASPASV